MNALFVDRRIMAFDGLDLRGKKVLDIGGYHGEMARYALDLGARSAICLDNAQYRRYQKPWEHPKPLPGVIYERGDFRKWRDGADIVVFSNVIYHVPSPWDAFVHLRKVTREYLSVQTNVISASDPVWLLNHEGDPTIFFRPSLSGLLLLLQRTGFHRQRVVGFYDDHVAVQAW